MTREVPGRTLRTHSLFGCGRGPAVLSRTPVPLRPPPTSKQGWIPKALPLVGDWAAKRTNGRQSTPGLLRRRVAGQRGLRPRPSLASVVGLQAGTRRLWGIQARRAIGRCCGLAVRNRLRFPQALSRRGGSARGPARSCSERPAGNRRTPVPRQVPASRPARSSTA